MKKIIIIRSLRVALVLAILSTSLGLVLFKSYWFLILTIVSAFFLDATDSMLAFRLKRIVASRTRTSFIYVYLVIAVVSICFCAVAIASITVPIIGDLYTLMEVLYPGLLALFSFRYFVIVVRVMAKHMDDEC